MSETAFFGAWFRLRTYFVEGDNMSQYCIYCGKELDDKSNFCSNCGKQTSDEARTTNIGEHHQPNCSMTKAKKTIIIGSVIAVILFIIGIAVGFENFDYIQDASIFGGPSWKYEAPSLAEWAEENGNKALFGVFLMFSAVITEIVTLVLFCSAKNAENLKQVFDEIKEKQFKG